MSLLFCRTNVRVSFIFEEGLFEDEDARVVGFRFDADGKVLESRTAFDGVVRRFLHDAATPMSRTPAPPPLHASRFRRPPGKY